MNRRRFLIASGALAGAAAVNPELLVAPASAKSAWIPDPRYEGQLVTRLISLYLWGEPGKPLAEWLSAEHVSQPFPAVVEQFDNGFDLVSECESWPPASLTATRWHGAGLFRDDILYMHHYWPTTHDAASGDRFTERWLFRVRGKTDPSWQDYLNALHSGADVPTIPKDGLTLTDEGADDILQRYMGLKS